jgi:hypothetical protein
MGAGFFFAQSPIPPKKSLQDWPRCDSSNPLLCRLPQTPFGGYCRFFRLPLLHQYRRRCSSRVADAYGTWKPERAATQNGHAEKPEGGYTGFAGYTGPQKISRRASACEAGVIAVKPGITDLLSLDTRVTRVRAETRGPSGPRVYLRFSEFISPATSGALRVLQPQERRIPYLRA